MNDEGERGLGDQETDVRLDETCEYSAAKVHFACSMQSSLEVGEGGNRMNAFDVLHPKLREFMKGKGFEKPTEPQTQAIPRIIEGKNILLIAPTGMGKTESAMLPIFHKILCEKPKAISALYITPLRALNRDMLRRMIEFGDALGVNVAVRHGDTSQSERVKMSKSPPDILITTPETFQILFSGRNLREQLKNVKHVVIDEVHELAQDERGAQLSIGLERLRLLAGREFQRIGLSATIGSPDEVARYIAGLGREIDVIRTAVAKTMAISVVAPEEHPEDKVVADKIRCDRIVVSALRLCKAIINDHNSTLFFVNTRDHAEGLGARLKVWDDKFAIGVHHGSLSKEVRVQMEDEFKSGILRALICTSSLELGIDVGSADHTIQYNSPRQVTRLVQRVGRSGHKVGEVSKGTIITTMPDDVAESAVIARKSLSEELERFTVREKPMGVLANQLVGFVMAGRITFHDAYSTIRRAYPFRRLTEEEMEKVLLQLEEVRVIRQDGDILRKAGKSIQYFYENISMIPDEKTYRIVDISSRRFVGTLDESFVASFAESGAKFISWGKSWQIVEVKDETVLVAPSDDIGAVPSWLGEEIPVPYAVAQEVGKMRGYIAREINAKKSKTSTIDELMKHYNTDARAFGMFYDYVKRHAEKHPVPTDKRITVEHGNKLIIINACFGSNVNETLGRALSALIASKAGAAIGLQADPYRIILDVPIFLTAESVCDMLRNLHPDSLQSLLRIVLRNSSYLRYQLFHVGRKFGAIDRGADFKLLSIPKLIDSFQNTPLYEEAIEKVIWEKMDIERAYDVLGRIRAGEIEVVQSSMSPIGLEGVERSKELMRPEKADRAILQILKNRLMNESVTMLCLACKRNWTRTVSELPDKVKCHLCGAVLVAAVSPRDEVSRKLIKKRALNECEKKEMKKLVLNANLVMEHGKKAVMALSARGVGPETAARIVRKYHDNEYEFLRDVLSAEINYARTKRFWD